MKKAVALIITIVLLLITGCSHLEALFNGDNYQNLLFDPSYVHSIVILLDEDDWERMHTDLDSSTRYRADMLIDGKLARNAAFSTKGCASLNDLVESGISKFSYRVDFDVLDGGQPWQGLDQLLLLNMYGDATYMKDFITYSMFRRMGVPSPLASYVWLKVNGEIQGLYLAVEGINGSFVNRYYNGEGSLYKPSEGSNLLFRGNDPSLYPGIFENDVLPGSLGSRERVIKSLMNITNHYDLENSLDTKEVTAYFAVHNFVLNFDSYTGKTMKNFYLYENDGRLSMLPWDYDLMYGGFPRDGVMSHGNDKELIINQGIDSPVDESSLSNRPMWNWILSDGYYLNEYHDQMELFLTKYFESGEFSVQTRAVYEMIRPYVENDPAALCTVDEFDDAYHMFRRISLLRASSVRRQLNGLLATVTDDQYEYERVDTSKVDLQDIFY